LRPGNKKVYKTYEDLLNFIIMNAIEVNAQIENRHSKAQQSLLFLPDRLHGS